VSCAVLLFTSKTFAVLTRLPVAVPAATTTGTVTLIKSPLAHVKLAPRLHTTSGLAGAAVTQAAEAE
jgi:hypothetical protein